MSFSLKRLVRIWGFAGLASAVPLSSAAPTGILEGHLKILLSKEVQLQDDAKATPEAPEQPYSEYPLIVRSREGGKEVARVTADTGGNYHLALPPGEYVLDIQRRPRGGVRATPQRFTVAAGQTVRVDLDIDTGVR
jgi:hypothetical protein